MKTFSWGNNSNRRQHLSGNYRRRIRHLWASRHLCRKNSGTEVTNLRPNWQEWRKILKLASKSSSRPSMSSWAMKASFRRPSAINQLETRCAQSFDLIIKIINQITNRQNLLRKSRKLLIRKRAPIRARSLIRSEIKKAKPRQKRKKLIMKAFLTILQPAVQWPLLRPTFKRCSHRWQCGETREKRLRRVRKMRKWTTNREKSWWWSPRCPTSSTRAPPRRRRTKTQVTALLTVI